MTGQQVDAFSAKLTQALSVLDWKTRNEMLVRIGRMELRMRAAGKERPIWRGPAPVEKILGSEVVIPTDQGERRGHVICFGVVNVGGDEWERSVIVHVPASGTQHEAPGSLARPASPEDLLRMQEETQMADRLAEAAAAAQRGPADPAEALRRQRKRGMRDPKLVQELADLARMSGSVSTVEEGGNNYKITSKDGTRRIYLFKTQLRVDISGYAVDHPGVRKISEEEARDMHLGKVRGQLLFDDRDQAVEAFKAALVGLTSAVV